MKVIITKSHCEGRIYQSTTNCPLCAALAEQYPELGLTHVGGSYVTNATSSVNLPFNKEYETGWHSKRINELVSGRIKEYVLDIPYPEYDNKQMLNSEPEAQVSDTRDDHSSNEAGKTKTVYVSVPTSITEQSKELILS